MDMYLFLSLHTVNNAAVSIGAHMSESLVAILWGICLEVELLDLWYSMFNF